MSGAKPEWQEAGMQYQFSAEIGNDEDGYWARCPELQGCYAQGETYDEALDALREAVAMHVDVCLECGEDVPQAGGVCLITIDVPE